MYKKLFSIIAFIAIMTSVFSGCGKEPVETNPIETQLQTEQEDTTAGTTEAVVPDTTVATTEATTVPETFELNRDDITLVTEGETWTLYEGDIDLSQITWSSDDSSVASFENGVVTALKIGQTTVHAEYNGVKSSCIIRCNLRNWTSSEEQPGETQNPSSTGARDPVKEPPTNYTVSESFFDDAVFIGDSVTLKLSYYAAGGGLGNAKFLVRGSYGMGHAANNTMLLTYQGQELKVEEAVAATGASKVFIMLGMNDIALYGIDQTITNWGTVVGRIREKSPGVTIYVQSMTPIWTGGEKGSLNNTNMDKYNERLRAFAQGNGCTFIDVASYMKDSTGGLATKYCSDSFVHFTDAGASAWIKVLRAFNY